ncbi:hypothetical protein E4L98_16620 [Duganella callida]|uniref:Uncharacterized protein n=1 Tax=Duganella callida TaxID=2561932 RepID=A0A4Y9SG92_9BURK|nr:hypothetical protein E4L98_16620 [Duganella callida]
MQAINSTVNLINNSAGPTQSGAPALPDTRVAQANGASAGGGSSAVDDKVPDEKNLDSNPRSSVAGNKEQIKKMYCN